MVEETKHDLILKRIQVIIAILGGLAAVIIGFYNVKKNLFPDNALGAVLISVRSAQGSSVSPAYLELYDSQNAIVASAQTSADGGYANKDLLAGSYLLKITAINYEPQAATIKIDPKKTTRLDIILRSLPNANAQAAASPIKSALEDAGASWIKKLAKTSETSQN